MRSAASRTTCRRPELGAPVSALHGQENAWRERTKLALRERLEEPQQAVLARIQDLARLADVDRAHLQAPLRIVVEQIFHVHPRELHGRRRVVVERRIRQALQP